MKIALSIGLLITLIVGFLCLFWPERVQEYALKWSVQGRGRLNPFLNWMKTRSYIIMLRIIGIAAIIAVAVAIHVVFRGPQE